MYKKIIIPLLLVTLMISFSGAREVASVNIPETLKEGNTVLVLNGAGEREKFFSTLTVVSLYLKAKSTNADAIINADEPMAIGTHIISDIITKETFVNALKDGFKLVTGGNTAPLKDRIKEFETSFLATGEIRVNNTFAYVWVPNEGLKCYKGKKLFTTIKGIDFKKGFFGIYLGKEPIQADLKDKMLNKVSE